MTGAGDEQTYEVVVNDEEQHSIWSTDRPRPTGWYDAGFTGSKEACLDHIEFHRAFIARTPQSAGVRRSPAHRP